LLGILAASQALSSETSVERLHARLAELLCSMTGATHAQLVLWKEESGDWLPAEHATPLPLSVLEYARRTRRPVMVADAATDERFAHDPSIAAAGARSLLVVPIVSRDTLRAVLLLENRFIRGAFSRERLDSVELLTGQLAVSLDNAGLYARYERIANEQAALRRVATLVARGVTSDAVFSAVADAAGSLFAADVSSIVRLEPDGQATAMGGHGVDDFVRGERSADSLTAAVRDTGRPVRRDAHDRSGELPDGIISAVAIPIVVEGRVWGVMSIGSRHERLPEDTAPRLAEFTALVGTAIANADSRAELTASRARIVNAADQARRRIQRDLHDGAQQRLVALQIRLQTLQARPPAGATELSAALQDAIDEASGAAEELRALAQGIHPAVLHAGLQAALKVLAGRAPMPVALQLETPSRMAEHLELSAYYIVAEALNNVAKHAHASKATVTISADSAQRLLEITVSDDGVGGADFEGGTGLVGLKDRADALGGSIELHGGPGVVGTTLRARLPLDSPML
jgi:signal transduction histidine kinase